MILSSRGNFSARAFAHPFRLIFKFKKRYFESKACDHEIQLTQTNIFVQEGARIQEVPLIVKKITSIETLLDKRRRRIIQSSNKTKKPAIYRKDNIPYSIGTRVKNGPLKHTISIETDEGMAILYCSDIERLKNTDVEQVLDAMNSGNTDKKVYSMLENKIANEINCRIALQSLRKMIELDSEWTRYRKTSSNAQSSIETINRDMILQQLVNLIVKSQDSEMILQGLKALKRDRFSPSTNIYKDRMCNEVMIRATDGELTISQLIRAMRILVNYGNSKYRNCIDMLWVGLACKEQDIKPDLLVPLFRSLKYFQRSKDMVQIILEKKLSEQWLKLTGSQMASILNCLYGKESVQGCLSSASKWANVSMTTSTEKDLVNFIGSLRMKKYVNENIEQALARYVTSKGTEMKDPRLIASIMDYCKDLRIRNPYVLAECGKYFIRHGPQIPPTLLSPIIASFGLLNLQPPDPTEFWKMFDEVISARFSDLKLNDALDILLSCTYLEKYPIKLLDKVFSSYLMNRLQTQRDAPIVNHLKNKLKLFDATMSLECKDYHGSPINLDRNTKSLSLDMRIRGIINKIHQPLAHLVGGEHKLSRSVVLSRLPFINFYILDILVHPLLKSTPVFNLNLHKKRNINTAILIYLPEYYCWNTQFLIGPQIMRKRQIRKLGFRVAHLDYAKLAELVDQDDKLLSYLSQSLDTAENAL
ncbi:FAKD3 protein, partial [Acromyrmex heyeri]